MDENQQKKAPQPEKEKRTCISCRKELPLNELDMFYDVCYGCQPRYRWGVDETHSPEAGDMSSAIGMLLLDFLDVPRWEGLKGNKDYAYLINSRDTKVRELLKAFRALAHAYHSIRKEVGELRNREAEYFRQWREAAELAEILKESRLYWMNKKDGRDYD